MRRICSAGLVFTALLASSMTALSASAAPRYFVAGSEFTGEESVNARVKSGTKVVFVSNIPGTLEIQCSAISLNTAVVKEKNKGSAKAISFEKCKVVIPAACSISATFTTNEVTMLAEDMGASGVSVKVAPKSGETFLTLFITGCVSEGAYPIKGHMTCEVLEPSVEAISKGCDFTSSSGSTLNFGTNPLTLTSESEFFLSGTKTGQKWSIRP